MPPHRVPPTDHPARRAVLGGLAAAVAAPLRRAASQARALRIGVLGTTTGATSWSGPGALAATRFAAADFATQLDGRPVEVLDADFQGRPDEAVAIARRWFDRAPRLLVAFVPVNTVLVLAGDSGMSVPTFVLANSFGATVLALSVREATSALTREIDTVQRWIGHHRIIVALLGVIVVGSTLWSHRNPPALELEDVHDVEPTSPTTDSAID